MAEGYRPTVYVCYLFSQIKLSQNGQRLHREGFVDFDQIEVLGR